MPEKLDPAVFGLSTRTEIVKIGSRHIAIVKNRKSRIIMKDGRQILEQAKAVMKMSPGSRVSLMTDAPVCSKTASFLHGEGIDITPIK